MSAFNQLRFVYKKLKRHFKVSITIKVKSDGMSVDAYDEPNSSTTDTSTYGIPYDASSEYQEQPMGVFVQPGQMVFLIDSDITATVGSTVTYGGNDYRIRRNEPIVMKGGTVCQVLHCESE